MRGRSPRRSFVHQSIILKISCNRPRRSYTMEPVTVDPIYNSRERCKISGLISSGKISALSNRFIILIFYRPPLVFIAYRMQFADSRNDIVYRSTNTYMRIYITYGAILYSSKIVKNQMFKQDLRN